MAYFWPSKKVCIQVMARPMTKLFQFLTCLAIIVLIVMSLRPSLSTGGVPNGDKVLHFLAYGFLAGLARLGWPKLWGGWIVFGLITLGWLMELGQHMMNQGRTASFADGIANSMGVLLVVALFHIYQLRKNNS